MGEPTGELLESDDEVVDLAMQENAPSTSSSSSSSSSSSLGSLTAVSPTAELGPSMSTGAYPQPVTDFQSTVLSPSRSEVSSTSLQSSSAPPSDSAATSPSRQSNRTKKRKNVT